MSSRTDDLMASMNVGPMGNQSRSGRTGTSFTDSRGNTFVYNDDGAPTFVGLSINGVPPKPASEPQIRPPPGGGLLVAGPKYGVSARNVYLSGLSSPEIEDASPIATDYPMSYNVGTGNYQIAARRAANDYFNALDSGDAQAMSRALRETKANPPDNLRPDTGPQMKAYDPEAEQLRARRFEDGMLGAVSVPAAWTGGLAEMLGKDERTQHRWMEGGAEIGSELSPFAAEAAGLLGNPAAKEALKPTGVPVDIGDKGAAMEGAARLSAYQRGAVRVFDGKYGGDHGFDGAYVLRDEKGYPQLHIDSVKAKKGKVPVYERGSLTELGSNNVKTRKDAEIALRKNISATPIDDDFTSEDKQAVLDQLDKGDVVVNLVGEPDTGFHQGHIDFINNETPYRFGTIRTLDPFSPSKAPLLNGAAYGLSSAPLSDFDPASKEH